MIPKSRLLSFMTNDECYAVHLLEGQNIIKDLALIHGLRGSGFLFYRDCILSAIPLISLLKHGETMGYYIDSKEPYFSFKVEMSDHGDFRTLMLPDNFDSFPQKITGHGRVTKIAVGKTPYNSIIELKDLAPSMMSNQMLKESYQMSGHILVSKDSDQSALIMKLPRKSWDKEQVLPDGVPFTQFVNQFSQNMNSLFNEGKSSELELIKKMEQNDYYYLKGKDINFKCSCSRERMVSGIVSLLTHHTLDEVFLDKSSIETKCDYCNTYYQIEKSELIRS